MYSICASRVATPFWVSLYFVETVLAAESHCALRGSEPHATRKCHEITSRGYVRLFRFVPAEKRVACYTIDPAKDGELVHQNGCWRGGGENAAERTRPVPELPHQTPGAGMFRQALPAYGLWARHVDSLILEGTIFALQEGTTDRRDAIVLDDVTQH